MIETIKKDTDSAGLKRTKRGFAVVSGVLKFAVGVYQSQDSLRVITGAKPKKKKKEEEKPKEKEEEKKDEKEEKKDEASGPKSGST